MHGVIDIDFLVTCGRHVKDEVVQSYKQCIFIYLKSRELEVQVLYMHKCHYYSFPASLHESHSICIIVCEFQTHDC
jgi:hypothetical protein